ncbi:unnamed protein product [Closterium sp. NIES-54]
MCSVTPFPFPSPTPYFVNIKTCTPFPSSLPRPLLPLSPFQNLVLRFLTGQSHARPAATYIVSRALVFHPRIAQPHQHPRPAPPRIPLAPRARRPRGLPRRLPRGAGRDGSTFADAEGRRAV